MRQRAALRVVVGAVEEGSIPVNRCVDGNVKVRQRRTALKRAVANLLEAVRETGNPRQRRASLESGFPDIQQAFRDVDLGHGCILVKRLFADDKHILRKSDRAAWPGVAHNGFAPHEEITALYGGGARRGGRVLVPAAFCDGWIAYRDLPCVLPAPGGLSKAAVPDARGFRQVNVCQVGAA